MRFAYALVIALAGALPPAGAQAVDLTLPATVQVGLPFNIDFATGCVLGEAPPIPICNGPSLALLEVSERTANFPSDPITLFPFEPVTYGPFVFHRKGQQYVIVWSTEGEFLGAATFVVQAPRRK